MKEGAVSPFLPKFIRLMGRNTASVEITYADYTVARNFLSTIDDWFKTIPCAVENKVMKFLQSYSYWIPRIGRFGTAIFVTFIVMSIVPHVINATETSLLNLAQFFLWSALGVYVAYTLAGWSTSFAEMAIDSWCEVSYIKLNRGDQIEIGKNQRENRGHLLKGICGGLGLISVDIVAKVTASVVIGYLGIN
jgi:hypothetical protein